jgi:hypothetical protein
VFLAHPLQAAELLLNLGLERGRRRGARRGGRRGAVGGGAGGEGAGRVDAGADEAPVYDAWGVGWLDRLIACQLCSSLVH